jgi:hypothetical protein
VGRLVLEPSDVRRRVPPGRMEVRGIQVAIVYGFLVLSLALVHAALGKFELRNFGSQALGGLFFLLPAVFAHAARATVERSWLKGYGQRPLDTEYTFSPEEIRIANHARDLRFKFSLVRYYIEQTSHFVLYGAGQIALAVIPKRAFEEGELSRLRALFVERLAPAPSVVLTVTRRSLLRPLLWTLLACLALFVATFVYVFITQT